MILASRQLLQELSGAKRATGVKAWLRLIGVRYVEGIDKWPRVAEAELEQLLVSGEREKRQARHNFGALADLQARA